MPGAVLHVFGEAFNPRPILTEMSLQPYSEFCRGDQCFPDSPWSERRHQVGGFKCEVSSADGLLADEVADAIAFLREHYDDLARLGGVPGVESKILDFGDYQRIDGEEVVVQCDYLPPELLRLAGELGIGIELSLYPKPERPWLTNRYNRPGPLLPRTLSHPLRGRPNTLVISRHLAADRATSYISPVGCPTELVKTPQIPRVGHATLDKKGFLFKVAPP